MKYNTLTTIVKFILLILSLISVACFYSNGKQLFNLNIVSYSQRFLTGKYVILMMALHMVLETVSVMNMFSHYATKYTSLNYILGILCIVISLPLFYNFYDDFAYYEGDVNPFSFLLPALYFAGGILSFLIAGKKVEEPA